MRWRSRPLRRRSLDGVEGRGGALGSLGLGLLHLGIRGGERVPFRDIVVLNAGAALIVGGKTGDLREGVERAQRAIDDGSTARALDKLVAVTNRAV